VTCPCGEKSHDYDRLFYFTAKYLLDRPDETRHIWRNWSDPSYKHHKSPSFLARVRAKIEAIKTGELI